MNSPTVYPRQHFRFCPVCGAALAPDPSLNTLHCSACGFFYYFNPAVAAGAIVQRSDGAALFIRRAKEPARGKLGVPGGFVDYGETAEASLRREIREETQVSVGPFVYLCSHANDYPYRGVNYRVLDLFFTTTARDPENAAPGDGVEALVWLQPREVDRAEIAFPSQRAAVEQWQDARLRKEVHRKPRGSHG